MKASMKFREEQKPLFRAKVPLNILGFPFQSGVVAGESKELSLNLSTFFESGPSVKVAYRPNDSINPFSLVFKTGIGHLGSPISSSLNMSAEFNLIGGAQNPSFFVHFKPQFGDFTVKKTQSSVFKKQMNSGGGVPDEDVPVIVDLFENGKKFSNSPLESPAAGLLKGVLSDVEMTATTTVPLRKQANLNFRWGFRLPATEETAMVLMKKNNKSTAGISFQTLPVLIINKIGIEHVARDHCRTSSKAGPGSSDVADAFLGVKKQLEMIQAENGMLRKAMDNLKAEFSAVKSGNNAVRFNGGDKGHFGRKAMDDDLVNDELKNGSKGISDI
ncbi:uncharacterized protein LOC112513404 [Cynara cardunculus var. scolymus]|uniref:uncharacterized protein LOC112513404 n=1 Tax=Cynara cardunculus var. scolymus TaxID=59895 RepID=UPI000D625F27|nr:uncharacterized protein LOC112513404 [Cynara cardunculus var. scolymus]